jgi:two-component system LytT family sensor kinase
LLCLWYGFNFAISTTFEYLVTRPFPSTIVNGIILYIALCLLALLAWRWSAFLFKSNIAVQIGGHLLGLALWFFTSATIYYFLDYYLDQFTTFDEWREFILEQLGSKSLQYNLEYITAIAAFYILSYIETIQDKENEKAQLAIANNEMRMSLLKSQINPHFLFNTLNSISTLMSSNKTKARAMLTMLSDVMRYALDSNSALDVPLEEELDFIRNYINIQQVRFGKRLQYEEDIDEQCKKLTIPPMVLQPLVENSVKHGITPKEDGGTIVLAIKRVNGLAHFSVSDNGIGINAGSQYESSNSGVGLINSDKRLQSMYGKDSKISIMADESGFVVNFKVPIE